MKSFRREAIRWFLTEANLQRGLFLPADFGEFYGDKEDVDDQVAITRGGISFFQSLPE